LFFKLSATFFAWQAVDISQTSFSPEKRTRGEELEEDVSLSSRGDGTHSGGSAVFSDEFE